MLYFFDHDEIICCGDCPLASDEVGVTYNDLWCNKLDREVDAWTKPEDCPLNPPLTIRLPDTIKYSLLFDERLERRIK